MYTMGAAFILPGKHCILTKIFPVSRKPTNEATSFAGNNADTNLYLHAFVLRISLISFVEMRKHC